MLIISQILMQVVNFQIDFVDCVFDQMLSLLCFGTRRRILLILLLASDANSVLIGSLYLQVIELERTRLSWLSEVGWRLIGAYHLWGR